jgi:AcrR family transcriptional regulator
MTAIEPLTPERRRLQTRDHLLAAAAQVFAQRGYHGATLDDVATAAGFTKGAVYSNFEGKEDLFLELIRVDALRGMAAVRDTLDQSEVPGVARIADFVGLVRNLPEAADSTAGLLYLEFLLYAARHASAREQLSRIDEEATKTLAEIIEVERRRQGVEPLESPTQSARLVEALFRGIGLLRLVEPDLVDDAFVEAAINFVARGLGAAPD